MISFKASIGKTVLCACFFPILALGVVCECILSSTLVRILCSFSRLDAQMWHNKSARIALVERSIGIERVLSCLFRAQERWVLSPERASFIWTATISIQYSVVFSQKLLGDL